MKIKMFIISLFVMLALPLLSQSNEYSFKLVTGEELFALAPFCAQQILQEFHGYPYLWEGTMEKSLADYQLFSTFDHTAVVVAYCDQEPVGFIAGTSFNNYDSHDFHGSIEIFKHNSLNSDDYFYISQVIIKPEHRGKQLTPGLFTLIEEYALSLGYSKACLLTESHEKHPLKPGNYRELDGLWIGLGYMKTDIFYTCSWLTVQITGDACEQEHAMQYWIKDLE